MIGTIIGDLAGSRFEHTPIKQKDFVLFSSALGCRTTDDTVMTLAVGAALLESHGDETVLAEAAVRWMRKLGRIYPNAGYGRAFRAWLTSDDPQPYGSYGNGAAMRVGPCGHAAETLEQAQRMARIVTEVTHNHPEAVRAAEAVAGAVFLAKTGRSKEELRDYITANYYALDFTLDEIRPDYEFHSSCQKSVPQALEAFFESTGFEDAIRNAVSIGGDSDTIAAITGSVAEAYYKVPRGLAAQAMALLDRSQQNAVRKFEAAFGDCREPAPERVPDPSNPFDALYDDEDVGLPF